MDRLQSMAIFAKAVEAGSFSAAAEALNLSSQLVGKHVQSLEQHLGVRLLNRTTRRQHLTEFGSTYYEKVKVILAEVESAENIAAETRAIPRGRLRINAPVTFGIHALSPKLPAYLQVNSEVRVELSLTNRFVDVIEEGFDATFRIGELSDSGLVARQLQPYRLVLCAAPSYLARTNPILHPHELSRHECLAFSHTELRHTWTLDGPDGRLVIPISGRLMVDSGEALLSAACAGLGLLLQPQELVATDLAEGRLVRVLSDYAPPTRPLHILYAPDRRLTPKLKSFIDFALQHWGTSSTS